MHMRTRTLVASLLGLFALALAISHAIWITQRAPAPAAPGLHMRGEDSELRLTAERLEVSEAALEHRVRVEHSRAADAADWSDVSFRFVSEDATRALTVDARVGESFAIDIGAGRYRVEVLDPPNAVLWPDRVSFAEQPASRELVLELGAAVELTVLTRDGEGVSTPNVPVLLERQGVALVRRQLNTGDTGRAQLRVPAGEYTWKVTSQAFSADGAPLETPLSGQATFEPVANEARLEIRAQAIRPRTLRVVASLTVDGGAAGSFAVTDFDVRWRGQLLRVGADGAGRFTAERELRGASNYDGSTARVTIRGRGIADAQFEVPDPGEGVDQLTFARNLEALREHIDAVVLDHHRRPVPHKRLRLCVEQSAQCSTYVIANVMTDARGRFRVDGVSLPCRFYVELDEPGIRVIPRDTEQLVVSTPRTVEVLLLPVHRVLLSVADSELARALAADAPRGGVIEVLPLTEVSDEIRCTWTDASKQLSARAAAGLANEGLIDLGDLPRGTYHATLFSPAFGAASVRFEADPSRAETTIPLEFAVRREELRGADARGARLVVDGAIPRTALAAMLDNYDMLASAGGMLACSRPDSEGRFALSVHNSAQPFVTLLMADGTVLRRDKSALSRDVLTASTDCVVRGSVFDAHGRPVPNVAVNLTGMRGGERRGVVAWPRAEDLLPAMTDEDGAFRVSGLPVGRYTLSVADLELADEGRTRSFQVEISSVRLIDARPGESVVDVRLEEHHGCEHDHGDEHEHEHGDEHGHDHR